MRGKGYQNGVLQQAVTRIVKLNDCSCFAKPEVAHKSQSTKSEHEQDAVGFTYENKGASDKAPCISSTAKHSSR